MPPTWTQALTTIKKPSLSNREASGLINLARAALRSFGRRLRASPELERLDWYQLALWALDWFKPGDRFKIDTAHQLAPYPNPLELWEQLNGLATKLDEAGVEFQRPTTVDPRGTDQGFRKLAADAWELMQARARLRDQDTSPVQAEPTPTAPTTTPATTQRPTTSATGGGLIWLLLFVAIAATERR